MRKILYSVMALMVLSVGAYSSAEATSSKQVSVNFAISPTITLSTSTSAVDFGSVSPMDGSIDKVGALNLTVQSNASYMIQGQSVGDFIGATPSNTLPISHLKAKIGSSWQTMSKSAPVTLIDNQVATSGREHSVDFRLDLPWVGVPVDTYSATINFTASQM